MLMSGIAKKMTMSKVNGGNAVKLGESNVYAVLGSTKKGQVEYTKLATVKDEVANDSSVPMKKVVNMPSDNSFQGYMNYIEVGQDFADTFADFSIDRYMEIMEYLEFDKELRLEKMSDVAIQKIKIAVTLSRNSRVYMLENPFKGMNSTAREKVIKVIFSWAVAAQTIAIMCNNTDEVMQMIDYAVEHEGDLPVISVSMNPVVSQSFA